MNINPIGMTIKDWCDIMVEELIDLGQAPYVQNDDWQQWGREVLRLPDVAAFNPPDPTFFDNFYEWAQRFNSTVLL